MVGRGCAEVSVARSTAHDNKLGRSDFEMHDFCTPSLHPPIYLQLAAEYPSPRSFARVGFRATGLDPME